MRISMLLPLVFLALAGCVETGSAPTPTTTTYVTPVQPPTTTVIRTP
jgi:hypothetical protein